MKATSQISKLLATGFKIKTAVKGGRLSGNHTRAGLIVKAGVKGGKLSTNHCRRALAADGNGRRHR